MNAAATAAQAGPAAPAPQATYDGHIPAPAMALGVLILALLFRKQIVALWRGLVRVWNFFVGVCAFVARAIRAVRKLYRRLAALILWPKFADGRDWNRRLRKVPPVASYAIQGGARFAECGEVARAGGFAPRGLPLGQFIDTEREVFLRRGRGPYLRDAGEGHVLLCAPAGAGKATDTIIPALLAPWDTGAWFVLDLKGGELAVVTHPARNASGRHAYYINPFHRLTDVLGPPVGYNPMRELDPNSRDFGIQCDGIATDVIEPTGGDMHWPDSATPLWSGTTAFFRKYQPEDLQNLVAVRAAIAAGFAAPKMFEAMIEEAMATGDPIISERLARFAHMHPEDRELRAILSTVLAQTHFMIASQAIMESLKGDFSFRTLRREPGASVFVIAPAEYLKDLRKWMRLLCGSALRELMSDTRGAPVNFLVDEFPELGYMPIFERVIGVARAFGIRAIFALQDLNQLHAIYKDRWLSFIANTRLRIFYAPDDPFTLEFLSKECGYRTIYPVTSSRGVSETRSVGSGSSITTSGKGEVSSGTSTSLSLSWGTSASTSVTPVRRELLLPQELKALGRDKQIIFKAGVPHPLLAIRRPYWAIRPLARRYLPDPYYTGPLPRSYRPAPAQPALAAMQPRARALDRLVRFLPRLISRTKWGRIA